MIGIRIGDNVIGIDSGIFDELSELNEAANTSVLQKASNERFQSISNDFIQKDGIFISRSNKKNRILKEFTSPNEDFIKSKKESAKKIYMKWQKDFITKDLRDGPLENSSIPKSFLDEVTSIFQTMVEKKGYHDYSIRVGRQPSSQKEFTVYYRGSRVGFFLCPKNLSI